MTPEEFSKNESAIMKQLKENGDIPSSYSLQEQKIRDYLKTNARSSVFTREKISKMTQAEYQKHEKTIDKQIKEIGVPTEKEIQNIGGSVHVEHYIRDDGVVVKSHYRSKPSHQRY